MMLRKKHHHEYYNTTKLFFMSGYFIYIFIHNTPIHTHTYTYMEEVPVA